MDDAAALCTQLLAAQPGPGRIEWENALRPVSEALLRNLLVILDRKSRRSVTSKTAKTFPIATASSQTSGVTLSGNSSDGSVSDSDSDGERSLLQLCDYTFDDSLPAASSSSTGGVRGVHRRAGGKYRAMVGLESFLITSDETSCLDDAVDTHIYLVRVRQLVWASLEVGCAFPDSVRRAVAAGTKERQGAGLPHIALNFHTQVWRRIDATQRGSRSIYTPITKNIESALTFWTHVKQLGSIISEQDPHRLWSN